MEISGQLHVPAASIPEPKYKFDRRLCGPKMLSSKYDNSLYVPLKAIYLMPTISYYTVNRVSVKLGF
jgi:hypothetical protein